MVNYGFVLLPLYIYPYPQSTWQPLFTAASNNPNVTIYAVINPNSGPSIKPGEVCPESDYVDALATLHTYPNIKTLGYVHTSSSDTCGDSGTDICTCSQPLSDLEKNITIYQNWPTAGCTTGTQDIHVDGIFIDESPSNSTCLDYMTSASSFVKSTLTRGNTVLFNAGTAVDTAYWGIADYINTFENSESAYDGADIGSLDGNGQYAGQTTLIIYDYTDGTSTLQRDVNTILSLKNDAIAGLGVTSSDSYAEFGSNWADFVAAVDAVATANGPN